MTRVSLRQRAIRRATRRVRFLTHVVILEVTGFCDLEGIGSGSEDDVPASLLWLLLSRRKLQALVANRYLHMHRDFVPKSAQWGTYMLDALPEHRWRRVVRVGRSTYNLLTDLLSEHLPRSHVPGDRPITPDRVQKIALFRLGHYGNSASTFFFFLYGTVDMCAWQKETYGVAQELTQCYFFPPFLCPHYARRYQRRRKHLRGQRGISHQMHKTLHWCRQQNGRQVHCVAI